MEYWLVIDQLALRRWHGKIDATDALLIGFISKLNPHNPQVAKYMMGDLFRLSRTWLLEQLPLLQLSPDRLGKRLKQLEKLGLLDLSHPRDQGGHLQLYGKLSRLFYRELEKVKQETEKALPSSAPTGANAHRAESPSGRLAQIPQAQTTDDHIKDHEEEPVAALPDGAADGTPEEKEKTPAAALHDRLALLTSAKTEEAGAPELSDEEYEKVTSAERASRAGLHAKFCNCEFCQKRVEKQEEASPPPADDFADDLFQEDA